MNGNKQIVNLLFWLTILSLPVSFSLTAIVGEVEIYDVAGIIRYSWIMLLFLPIGILTLVTGRHLKKAGHNYKKLFIAAWVCIPLLLIFGSYRLIFQDVSYEISDIYAVERKTKLNLPDSIKIASHSSAGYRISYLKITDDNEAASFTQDISQNAHWVPTLSTTSKGLLPFNIQVEMHNFDYFVFYDLEAGTYNQQPEAGECRYVFIAYDVELQRMIILDDYHATMVIP